MYEYLEHHGIKGQRWGVRRYQNPDGSLTPEGRAHYLGETTSKVNKNQTVFVSGSSKTQDKESGYYRKRLPHTVRYELNYHIKRGDKIIVGDAPGIDRQTQDYLAKKNYTNVEVFSPGKKGARYLANPSWKQTNVDKPGAEIGSKEWLAAKDLVMSKLADKGIAVTIDEGAKATRKNVDRLVEANKDVMVYELSKNQGFIRNLFSRGDRATTFVNGKEIPEDYDEFTDGGRNVYGEVPKHEYGTRTKEIAAKKIASETKKAEQLRLKELGVTDEVIKRTPDLAYIKLRKAGYRPSQASKTIGQSAKDDGKPSGDLRTWADKYGTNKNDIAALKARQNRARSLKNSGYTIVQIADKMGEPFNNVKDYLYEDIDSLG